MHLQRSVHAKSQGDLWSGGNCSRLNAVVKADQMVHFEAEYRALSNAESINPKFTMAPVYPFMDNGVIRVGGRLAHGYSMTDDQWFPLLVSHSTEANWLHLQSTMPTNDSTATVSEMKRQECPQERRKRQRASIQCHVLPLQFRANAAAQGRLALQSH